MKFWQFMIAVLVLSRISTIILRELTYYFHLRGIQNGYLPQLVRGSDEEVNRVLDAVRDIAAKYSIARTFVLQRGEVFSPASIAISLFHAEPIILICERVRTYTEEELRGVLAHELAHEKTKYTLLGILHGFIGAPIFSNLVQEATVDKVAATHVGTNPLIRALQRVEGEIYSQEDSFICLSARELSLRIRRLQRLDLRSCQNEKE